MCKLFTLQRLIPEIRQILSTPPLVNEVDGHIDLDQQDTNEHEITITAIIEEINDSSSSKSNPLTHEALEDKLVIYEDTLEQSTRDEF